VIKQQELTVKAIVNIFETGRVAGDYGSVTLLKGDAGHLTYGRSQTTLASGNLFLLIKNYCDRPDAARAADFQPFLDDLAANNFALDSNAQLRQLLKEAGDDPAMQSEQDQFFDRIYFNPACRTAAAKGVTLPLGQAVVYDSYVHSGRIRPQLGVNIGDGGVDEKTWVAQYVDARKNWLLGLKDPLPKTVYRMESFRKLISDGAWDLPLPLNVHGVSITADALAGSSPIVRAAAVDPTDPPALPVLRLTSPYMRGPEVRRLQEALNNAGFANGCDGLFGPFTETLVKKFQVAKQLKNDGIVGPSTRAALGL